MENRMESLRQNWFVIQQLIKRDKQRSLSSTFMGELWEIINPLINMIVMVLVLARCLVMVLLEGFRFMYLRERHFMDCLLLELLCVCRH